MPDIEKVFESFPNSEYWKLFIDVDKWGEGEMAFDKDLSPGYLQSVSRAFLYNFLTINRDLDVDMIVWLHGVAFHDKTDKSKLGFESYGNSGLIPDFVSEAGLIELINNIRNNNVDLELFPADENGEVDTPLVAGFPNIPADALAKEIMGMLNQKEWPGLRLIRRTSANDAFMQTQKYLDRYKQEILASGGDEEKKLSAIARFIRDIHQYHPFMDGNGRTFIFIILNKLLMQNNLAPCIVEKPGRFSGHSVSELVGEIKKGQLIFKSLCESQPLEKKTSIVNQFRTVAKVDLQTENKDMLRIDLVEMYQKAQSDMLARAVIHDNLKFIYTDMLSKPKFVDMIDIFFKEMPPHASWAPDILKEAADSSNFDLLLKTITFYQKFDQTALGNYYHPQEGSTDLDKLLSQFQVNQAIQVVKALNLHPDQVFNILDKSFSDYTDRSFFYTMFAYSKEELGKYMLMQLHPQHLTKLLCDDHKGITGLQIVGLFGDPALFKYCCQILVSQNKNANQTIDIDELLERPIITTQEILRSKSKSDPDFQKQLIKHGKKIESVLSENQKEKEALSQHGYFGSRSSVSGGAVTQQNANNTIDKDEDHSAKKR